MSIVFFPNSGYTPFSKRSGVLNGAISAYGIWTSSTNLKPVLTDYSIEQWGVAGTVQIKYLFGPVATSSSVIFEHLLNASGSVVRKLSAPFVGSTNNSTIFIENGNSYQLSVNLSGFEM